MGEQAGGSCEHPGPPPTEGLVGPQPPVLPPGPAPQVGVDALQEGIERGPVEPAVVVDPPGDDGVQPARQVVQRQVGAPMDPHLRSSAPLALSASGLIAGKNPVKFRPLLLRAPRARKAYPRKVNEVCSCSARR